MQQYTSFSDRLFKMNFLHIRNPSLWVLDSQQASHAENIII